MYGCIDVNVLMYMYGCMFVLVFAYGCTDVCMYEWMYGCMEVWVCMY